MRRFVPPTLSPKRLEKRRVLDAGAAELLLGPLVDSEQFVQAGENLVASGTIEEGTEQGPTNLSLYLGESELFENEAIELAVMFESSSSKATHKITIDWGDGSPLETHVLDPGIRYLGTGHQYLDDGPTSAAVDINTIKVRVFDPDGNKATATAALTVKNVPPTIDSLSITSPIIEGQTATLTGTFSDPGTQDTYLLDIDWDGDNTFDQTIEVSGGEFEVSRLFVDDNPTRTLSDTFDVTVRLRERRLGVRHKERAANDSGPIADQCADRSDRHDRRKRLRRDLRHVRRSRPRRHALCHH